MGFTPQQVKAMSPWEWAAALDFYLETHAPKDGETFTLLSDEEFAEAERMLEG